MTGVYEEELEVMVERKINYNTNHKKPNIPLSYVTAESMSF